MDKRGRLLGQERRKVMVSVTRIFKKNQSLLKFLMSKNVF